MSISLANTRRPKMVDAMHDCVRTTQPVFTEEMVAPIIITKRRKASSHNLLLLMLTSRETWSLGTHNGKFSIKSELIMFHFPSIFALIIPNFYFYTVICSLPGNFRYGGAVQWRIQRAERERKPENPSSVAQADSLLEANPHLGYAIASQKNRNLNKSFFSLKFTRFGLISFLPWTRNGAWRE